MYLLRVCTQFNLKIPLVTPSAFQDSTGQQPAVGRYMLSYLDDDTLIGRSQTGGGSFIFQRAERSELD